MKKKLEMINKKIEKGEALEDERKAPREPFIKNIGRKGVASVCVSCNRSMEKDVNAPNTALN